MMDPRNWPWRKKGGNHDRSVRGHTCTPPQQQQQQQSLTGAISLQNYHSSDNVSPNGSTSPSFEAFNGVPTSQAKAPFLSTQISKPSEALAWRKQAEHELKVLKDKLEDAERDSVTKDAMVQQHGKVAEEAISGWERAEVEATSLRQQLATSEEQMALLKQELSASNQQTAVLEVRVIDKEESLRAYVKQLRQAEEEQQQKVAEAIDKKAQEWASIKVEMEGVQADLRLSMLAAEAQNAAMTKSLQERAKAIVHCQQGKAALEMEMGLLQVKLESQATELSAARYELQVLTKELAICKEDRDRTRKSAEAAHKQHLEDVKKVAKIHTECQRLRNLVRKRVPGPAGALAQMSNMETTPGVRSKQAKSRRHSLPSVFGSVSVVDGRAGHLVPSSHRELEAADQCESDMASRLLVVEEETKILRETLAKRTCELHSARQLCARTAKKLSVAEEQLESLQGTPTSVRSSQHAGLAVDFDILHSDEATVLQFGRPPDSDGQRLDDDEVSCAESWASALITELAVFKKTKQSPDDCIAGTDAGIIEMQNNEGTNSAEDSPATLSKLALACKDAQLQSVNLMCKDAITKLACAEAKLGSTWMSENPRSNVEEGINSVAEANGIMSKLDKILDDIRIAVASVGSKTDEDSQSDKSILSSVDGQDQTLVRGTASAHPNGAADDDELGCKKQEVDSQAKLVAELQTLSGDLQRRLSSVEEELHATQCELVESKKQAAGELLEVKAEEASKRAECEAQLEAAKAEIGRLQTGVATLREELAEQREKYKSECEVQNLKGYVMNSKPLAAVTCRFEEVDARARKEIEVAAAKEKLAECQETILMLGKQLTAFSTSPSCASFDSAMSRRYQYSCQKPCQVQDVTSHVNGSGTQYNQRRPPLYSLTSIQDQANFNDNGCGYSSQGVIWPSNRKAIIDDDPHLPDVHVGGAVLRHSNPCSRIHSDLSQRSSIKNNGRVQYSVAEYLQMEESSPTSSLSLSPSRGGSQRNADQGTVTGGLRRTSLERAAAANPHYPHTTGAAAAGVGGSGRGRVKTGGGSSFSRFFGRSKNIKK